MKVRNVHERVLVAAPGRVGELIDGLAAPDDRLWPGDRWPPIRFDRQLSVGAAGGHGPVRYVVESFEPGRSIRFRFTGPPGFHGCHVFETEEIDGSRVALRHVIDMETRGPARLTWPLVFRPLHNALIEDALDNAAAHCGSNSEAKTWTPWVRFLRWALRGNLVLSG